MGLECGEMRLLPPLSVACRGLGYVHTGVGDGTVGPAAGAVVL